MLKTALLLALVVVVSTIGYVAFSWWRFETRIAGEVARLSSGASRDSAAVTDAMLAGLPEPARRYFTHARVVGRTIPQVVRLEQSGRIRSSAEASWMTFEAEQVYSTRPPAFVWRAWLPGRAVPMVVGRDTYLDGDSSIVMRMLGTVPVADEHGPELAAAGLMRYLNEMTLWFPGALLGENVTIAPVGDDTFSVSITDRGMTARAEVMVDADGRPVNFRADRYNTATRSMETWETPITGHTVHEETDLPLSGAGVWKLPDGDFTYIELEVMRVDYDPAAP